MADAEPEQRFNPQIWKHSGTILKPDAARTVLKPFAPEYPDPYGGEYGSRTHNIVERILSVGDDLAMRGLKYMTDLLAERHRNVETILMRRYDALGDAVPDRTGISHERALLIGGFFSEEYSFEAAALFNPSIVRHWDQSGVPDGAIRFVLSLRGIGEGHVSSVTFRTGVWGADGGVTVDPPSRYATPPLIRPMEGEADAAALRLAFEDACDLSEAVLFPMAPSQKQGIEDLRLVHFTEEDGTTSYRGTYTAFSGADIRQEVLHTEDFSTFSMRPLEGKASANKGMALFPRRVNGRYAMLGRQDNESIWLMLSDDLHRWDEAVRIIQPLHPWEYVQMGNCGSPQEIDEGWLVVTHSVGLVRNYTIGAALLDKDDPSKVIARTNTPILRPLENARDGYVPNVVYSCGSLRDGRRLLVPYGVADNYAAFASTTVDEILSCMA